MRVGAAGQVGIDSGKVEPQLTRIARSNPAGGIPTLVAMRQTRIPPWVGQAGRPRKLGSSSPGSSPQKSGYERGVGRSPRPFSCAPVSSVTPQSESWRVACDSFEDAVEVGVGEGPRRSPSRKIGACSDARPYAAAVSSG
jgi:hypothetical protein